MANRAPHLGNACFRVLGIEHGLKIDVVELLDVAVDGIDVVEAVASGHQHDQHHAGKAYGEFGCERETLQKSHHKPLQLQKLRGSAWPWSSQSFVLRSSIRFCGPHASHFFEI